MGVQYRGCSHLYYASVTIASDGTITFGTPTQLAPVKSVSRDITNDNEKIFADNVTQEITYGATSINRSFDTIKIADSIQAELLGQTAVSIDTDLTGYATNPDGSTKPYVAVGYALHDGNVDKPCLLVWSFMNKCNSISQTANTIDDGTGSEGQTIEFECVAPKKAWATTGKRNLDIAIPIADDATASDAATLVGKFFTQVVTPDNAATVLA